MHQKRASEEILTQVVIPVHSPSRPIRRAVESVLADPHSEALVVAHGVEPTELDLDLEHPRVRVIAVPDGQGRPGVAFNAGVAAATAPWVAIMGSDDWFEPGALATMRRRAVEDHADVVVAPLAYQDGSRGFAPTTLRTRNLQASRDRLFYRTAPLGLIRREVAQRAAYRFDEDEEVGEDVATGAKLWSSGMSISYHPDDPAYVVGDDAKDRTTLAPRRLSEQGQAWMRVWDDPVIRNLDQRELTALATKILRVHVLGVLRSRRAEEDWGEGDFEWLSQLVRRIDAVAPDAVRSLRSSSRRTIEAARDGRLPAALEAISLEEEGTGLREMLPRSAAEIGRVDGPVRMWATTGLHAAARAVRDAVSAFPFPSKNAEEGGDGNVRPEGEKPRLLVLSFSPIERDARVLRQISLLSDGWEVTTCGYGDKPPGVDSHIPLPSSLSPARLSGRLITLKQYHLVYWLNPAIKNAWRTLRGQRFDAIIANDIEAVPLALRLRPSNGVHADLHEHYPSLHAYLPNWKRRIAPYMRWLLRRYAMEADSATTVSEGLREAYAEEFGFDAPVVPNASMYTDFKPGAVHEPIRLVHSGACLRNRDLGAMARAAELSTIDLTLDFYLTPNDPAYLEELKAMCEGSSRVRVLDPVPASELVEVLNRYDVGAHVLPPVSLSHRFALPNKLYDFIQARLGVIVGPSPEMARVVGECGNGAVARGFGVDDLVEVLNSLTVEQVALWKSASDAAAWRLSAENSVGPWRVALDRMKGSAK